MLCNDANVSNGDTVYKEVFSEDGGTATPYTVVKIGAKLKKYTRQTATLNFIKNIPLDWFDNASMTNYRVKWNGSKFVKFATMSQSDWFWKNITESDLDLSELDFGELNFWSQAIGGQVRVPLPNCTWDDVEMKSSCGSPDNDTEVIYFTEDIVYPDDTVPSSFRCYDNCPKYDASSGVVNHESDFSPEATGHTYTFADMLLKDTDDNSLLMTSESESMQWGFNSGPLFEPTAENLALLACDWDPTETCGWKGWSVLSEYYTYETGPNQWNQFSGLKDSSGVFLAFEAPLAVEYTHSQTDTSAIDYKYHGVKFFLDYGGFGDLQGIPGVCRSMDTGEVTNCSDGSDIRWSPEFMVPEGATMTAGGATYYVKPLEVEQVMKSTTCPSGLSVTDFDLPEISLWEDPAIGAEPTVEGAPAVIGGVLQ